MVGWSTTLIAGIGIGIAGIGIGTGIGRVVRCAYLASWYWSTTLIEC